MFLSLVLVACLIFGWLGFAVDLLFMIAYCFWLFIVWCLLYLFAVGVLIDVALVCLGAVLLAGWFAYYCVGWWLFIVFDLL